MRKKCDHSNFDLGQGTIGIVGIGKGVGNGKVGSGKVGSGTTVAVGGGRVGCEVTTGAGVADDGKGSVGNGKVGSGNPVTVGRGRVGKRVGRRVVNGDGVADGANVGCMVAVGVAIITSVL